MNDTIENPTDDDIKSKLRQVIYKLATMCLKGGCKSDDVRSLAAIINASTMAESNIIIWSTEGSCKIWSKKEIARKMREEYGIHEENITPPVFSSQEAEELSENITYEHEDELPPPITDLSTSAMNDPLRK